MERSMSRKEGYAVLIVDDDPLVHSSMAAYLSRTGIATAVASSGQSALELFGQIKPDVVVADLRMPAMDGLDLLKNIKKTGSTVPVILMTGSPDTASAIQALQDGAYDYIVKPVHLPMLSEKIRKALDTKDGPSRNTTLSEIVAQNTVTSELAATTNMDALLDIVFRYGCELTDAPIGAIFLRGANKSELLCVRRRGLSAPVTGPLNAENERYAIVQQAFATGKSIRIEQGIVIRGESPEVFGPGNLFRKIHALVAVPMTISREVVGVFLVERELPAPPFTEIDGTRIEMLASQAGIAINNATLYASLNRKLAELTVVSTFSERIMGKNDKGELIRALFEKVREHCEVDAIAFFLVQQRRPEFFYWTRGVLGEADLTALRAELLDRLQQQIAGTVGEGGMIRVDLPSTENDAGVLRPPFAFKHIVPVAWQEGELGIFFAGAISQRFENSGSETLIEGLLNQIRIALVNAKLYNDMKNSYLRTIKALAIAVDSKDAYTSGHSENVMLLAEELAREIKECDTRRISIIRDAGLLHDIGKIGVPMDILNKPGALTYDEFNGVMKNHSTLGANIVKNVPFLTDLYKLILHHHEHFDGSGYPSGLKGEEIPLGARILHVVDAFDAMTSNRPYRSSLGAKEAIRRLIADSGSHFDPAIVNAFLTILKRKGFFK
jgi:putative nucleotidyltransferase with HDIG domain